jgi:OOP family OmpA-OmpF porin
MQLETRLARLVTLPVVLVAMASASAEPAAPGYTLDAHQLVLNRPILFKTGGAELLPESDEALAIVQGYLAAKEVITLLRIESHTDALGDDAANQALSEQRALAVAKALVARGVDCKRLVPVGFGETKPVAPDDTAEGRAQNRRTTFFNAALRGRAIGGMPVDGGGRVAGDPCR